MEQTARGHGSFSRTAGAFRRDHPACDVDPAKKKSNYGYEDLLECAHGRLFGPGNARLPLPPLLMLDRITQITDKGGKYGKGELIAEQDIKPDLWFFKYHFESDPIMPGAFGLDAMWQLLGFFLGWTGAPGAGRALGVGEVRFSGQILPAVKKLIYHLDIKRVVARQVVLGIADGTVTADGQLTYEAKDMRVGLFASPPKLA